MGLCKLECYTDEDESVRYTNKTSEKCQRSVCTDKPFNKRCIAKFETFTNTTGYCACDSYLKAEKESTKSSKSEINSDSYKLKCTYCKEPVKNSQLYKKYDRNYGNSQKRRRKVIQCTNIFESSTPLEETESVDVSEEQSEILSTSNKCCACICPCYIKKRSIDEPVKETGRKTKNELFTESVKYFNNLINNSEKSSLNDIPRTKNKHIRKCSYSLYQKAELSKTNNIEEQVTAVNNKIYPEETDTPENKPIDESELLKLTPDKTDNSVEENASTKDDDITTNLEEEKCAISLTKSKQQQRKSSTSDKGCVCDLAYVSKESMDISVKEPMDLSVKEAKINSGTDQSDSSQRDLNNIPDNKTEESNFNEINIEEPLNLIHCSCCPFSSARKYKQLANPTTNEPIVNENQNPNNQQDFYNNQNKTYDTVNISSRDFNENLITTDSLKETILNEHGFTNCPYNLKEKKLLLMKLLQEELLKTMSHEEQEKERLVNEHKQCFCSCPCKTHHPSLMDKFSKSLIHESYIPHEHHHSSHKLEKRLTNCFLGNSEKIKKTNDKKLITNSSSTNDLLTNNLIKQAHMLTVEQSQSIVDDSNLNEEHQTSKSTQEPVGTCSTKCAAKGEPVYYSTRSIKKQHSIKDSLSESDYDITKHQSSLKESLKYPLRSRPTRELLNEINTITKGPIDEDDALSKKSIKFSEGEDLQRNAEKINKKLENGSNSGCKYQRNSFTEKSEKFIRESHIDDLKYCKAKKSVQTKCNCQCLCLHEESFDDEHSRFEEDERRSERLERRNGKKNKKKNLSCIRRCKELDSFPGSTEDDIKTIEDYFRNQKKNTNTVKTDKSKYYYFMQNTKCQIAADYETKTRASNVEKINYNFLTLEAQKSDTSIKPQPIERSSITSEDNRKLFGIIDTTSITAAPDEHSIVTIDFKTEPETIFPKDHNLQEDDKTWQTHSRGLSANLDTYGSLEKIVSANLTKTEHRGSGLSVVSTNKEPASVFEEILREEKKKLSKHSATASVNSKDSHTPSMGSKVRGRGSSRFFDFFRGWMTSKSDIKQKRLRKKKIIKIRQSDEDILSDSLSDETIRSTNDDDDVPSHKRISINSYKSRPFPSGTLRQPAYYSK